MRILTIGDVFGRMGRKVLLELLKDIRKDYRIDFVMANIENAAAGFGILPYMAEEFLAAGVDVMTSGNHIFDKRDIIDYIKGQPRLLRPANYAASVPGQGLWCGKLADNIGIAVINLQGRVFMAANDCPFQTVNRLLEELQGRYPVIVVDHHAEATSEKVAMGWYLDGRVSVVVGTHTHVPTADERVLPQGTAYLTDLGMTGAYDSVIGIEKKVVIDKFLDGMPRKFEPAVGDVRLSGAVIDVDEKTGKARSISRLHLYSD
jgi:2',3'-cyclic-nucleotide 2'-phosphodiesterase